MLGVLAGYWIFASFIDPAIPASRAGCRSIMCSPRSPRRRAAARVIRLDESAVARPAMPRTARQKFARMFALAARPLIASFLASVFCTC